MPTDRPDALELIEAVKAFLREEAAPALDSRRGYHARVAANALDIALRELRQGAAMNDAERERLAKLLGRDGALDELNRVLASAIRNGGPTAGGKAVLAHLRQTAADKLAIVNPRYRARQKG